MEFHKYPKILYTDHKDNADLFADPNSVFAVEEKLDGANFRFMITKEGIIFGSHTRQLTGDQEKEKNWQSCIAYVKSKLEARELADYHNFIFYGECMIQHSIAYDWSRTPRFIGFDIYNLETDRFLLDKDIIFNRLGFDNVPFLGFYTAAELAKIDLVSLVPKSKYYNGMAEGIVLKDYTRQRFAKTVTAKFKEVNKAVFGKSRKQAENDNERLVAIYCTNARIDKQIFKAVADGKKLSLELMHIVPKLVLDDMYAENWQEIVNSNYTINFRQIKSIVSRRCLEVLKQVIANTELNKVVVNG